MCLLVPACAAVLLAQAGDPIDAIVAAQMAAQRIPGVAVAVVRRGEVVAAQGYGLANVEHEVPVTDGPSSSRGRSASSSPRRR